MDLQLHCVGETCMLKEIENQHLRAIFLAGTEEVTLMYVRWIHIVRFHRNKVDEFTQKEKVNYNQINVFIATALWKL